MDLYSLFIYPIIYILPAYVANGAPVIFGGGRQLDLGKRFRGKPILGRHKTIRGLLFGLASGLVVAYAESLFIPYMLFVGVLLSIGAHAGDLIGSFAKRRAGRLEGESLAFFDQYLFLIFALIIAAPLGHLPTLPGLVFLAVLTGVMHRLTNILAHRIKIKKVPW